MIPGVIIEPLAVIEDRRGDVLHMLRRDGALFEAFGEIYFSAVRYGAVKAWRRHKRMTLNLAVPVGKVRVVLYDDRKNSPAGGRVQEVIVGRDRYALIRIPPGIWSGFQGLQAPESLVANCATLPHDPEEIERRDPDDVGIPYFWNPLDACRNRY